MRLYAIKRPSNHLEGGCTEVAPVGDIGYVVCKSCNYYMGRLKPEVRVLEWLEGSDRICDFTWPARLIAEVIVQERVRLALSNEPIEWIPIEWYQDPKLKRPKRPQKRSKKRVWLPYEGPPVYILWATAWVHADLDRSSLRLIKDCETCGIKRYLVEGIEEKSSRYDKELKDLVPVYNPRIPGKGIYVHEADLKGANIFRLYESPGRILCTEPLKNLIEQMGFTNVEFIEIGDVICTI